MVDLADVWTLIVDGYDAELYSDGDVPALESSVDCAAWSTKFGTQDIGDEDYWCDAGRAYWCAEVADADGLRPLCSGSQPSQDSYGVWALLRAESSEAATSSSAMETLEDDYFGAGPEFVDGDEHCVDDVTFVSEGPWDSGYCDIETAISCVYDGVPCTIDAALARRAFNSQITPSTNLASDPSDWPRNVFIANEALSAESLETLLAGAEYIDDVDRDTLAAVWQWFPALCAEKPSDSAMSYMETCRWEFLAVTIMALSAELDEQEFNNIKLNGLESTDADYLYYEDLDEYWDFYYQIENLEWYQTSFMTLGDEYCSYEEGYYGTGNSEVSSYCDFQDADWADTAGFA
jgi:hypothetical protein